MARMQLAEGWSGATAPALRWVLYDDIHDALLERWPHEAAKISSMMVMWVTEIRGGSALADAALQAAVQEHRPGGMER